MAAEALVGQGKFLYLSLRKAIEEEYSGAEYYTPLPSERELCDKYQVSRSTVRKTLQSMERDGLVQSLHGKGTFYTGSRQNSVDHFVERAISVVGNRELSHFDQVTSQGGTSTSKVLLQDVRPADAEIAQRLGIAEGDRVFCLERARYINGELYQINSSRLPYDLCPDLYKCDFTGSVSLHQTLREHGLFPYRGDQLIYFDKANEYDALHLEIEPGSPVTVINTVTTDATGRVLEVVVTKSSAFKTQFEITVFTEAKAPTS